MAKFNVDFGDPATDRVIVCNQPFSWDGIAAMEIEPNLWSITAPVGAVGTFDFRDKSKT